MKILESDLDTAAQRGIIDSDQATKLWNYFDSLRPDQSRFHGLHVLYYFGGILILSSMSWLLTTAWNDGRAVMSISGVFGLMYVIVGNTLWTKQKLKIPEGIYIETHNWRKAVRFGKELGFELVFETDHHSGELRNPEGGPYIFLAERPASKELELTPVIAIGNHKTFRTPRTGNVIRKFKKEHTGESWKCSLTTLTIAF